MAIVFSFIGGFGACITAEFVALIVFAIWDDRRKRVS